MRSAAGFQLTSRIEVAGGFPPQSLSLALLQALWDRQVSADLYLASLGNKEDLALWRLVELERRCLIATFGNNYSRPAL